LCTFATVGEAAAFPRQDQDETGRQSVQEPAGIKQNHYALAMAGFSKILSNWPIELE
jgi:hypothetical protein